MRRSVCLVLGVLAVLGALVAPVALALRQQARMRNFRVVKDGVLYRSGQMHLDALKRILHDYGIRTVISLRDSLDGVGPPPDKAEEAFCGDEELNFYRFPPRSWDTCEGAAPADASVQRFLAIVRDPRMQPVLIHCFAGIHRTGAYCAAYRMQVDHWSNARAIAEVKACGYVHLDEELDILGYLEQYCPSWKTADARPAPPATVLRK
jgi:protein tyrosine/serine phosphatase